MLANIDFSEIKDDLKSQIKNKLIKEPFPIFICNNFLPKSISKKIKYDFKKIISQENIIYETGKNTNYDEKKNLYSVIGGGRSIGRKEEFINLFKSSKSWIDLINFFSSNEFLNCLIEPLNLNKRVLFKNSNYKKNLFQDLFYHTVYPTFKISRYPSGSGMAYHRDFDDKFLSCMYYLGFSDEVERNFGGTQFAYETNHIFKLKNNFFDNIIREKKIIDHYSNDKRNFKLFKDVKPNLNTFVYFLKTDNSWHKVDSFDLPKNTTRDNIQINLMHCKYDWISNTLLKLKRHSILLAKNVYHEFLSFKFYFNEKIISKYFYEIKKDSKNFYVKKKNLSFFYFLIRKLKDFIHFIRSSTLLVKSKKRQIRELIFRICEPLNKNIYLVANYALDYLEVPKNPKILCFGVLDDLRFEEKVSKDFNTPVFVADPTPYTVEFIKKIKNPNIIFSDMALSNINGDIKFYINSEVTTERLKDGSIYKKSKDQKYIVVKSLNLKNFMNKWDCKFCDVLKMDIEGSEIDILNEIISYQKEDMPIQIVCEIDIGVDFYQSKWKIYGILIDLKKYYKIYYIPRLKRYSHLDLLFVKKK